MKERQMCA